jgi:metaxin
MWFLGSSHPTPLDALVFAYLHCILHTSDTIRIEVTRRVNLVAWEWRVRCLVREAFAL